MRGRIDEKQTTPPFTLVAKEVYAMRLHKTEDYHEGYGCCLFFSFSWEDGKILGEPPEVCLSHGYIECGFDENKWTHFTKDFDINAVFEQADPIQFPPTS